MALLAACGKKPEPAAPPPPEVTVVTLKAQPTTLDTELPGRTMAYRVADVRPQVAGVILKRLFTEGSVVKAGQPLYQIDPATYEAAYASARADAVAAKAQAERYEQLVSANAISKQDYDNAVATHLKAEAAAEQARINLVYTRVLAPISGRIGRSSVTEGALVTAGQTTALATIQQLDPIYVDATQPSTMLLRLRREFASGQLKKVGEQQAEVKLTLEDGSAYAHAGKLQFSEVAVDPTSGSVTLRAVFPNPDELLLPGMFVHQRIQEGVDENALLVPQQAVTRDQRGEATALVVDAGNKVEPRVLQAERTIGDQWLVTGGVKAGERVIVEGLQKVKPGATVKAVEQGDAPTTPAPAAAAAGKA
ncbi:efflux RND transporter periplasmic adaptor subunit [Solimonas soli]|uniref:efflux RND transporter periplasmic adaptor subunit n=1 Tax=Solimonas soli TaxID=413479 RepID=UPI0004AE690B|nr:efflux RND transporter periplasmic adaptor subunit [Solimonas soli]